MYFVSDKDVTLEDRHDNVQVFKAGVPTIAHPSIAQLAVSYGLKPCKAPEAVVEPEGPSLEQVVQAIRELMDKGDKKLFSSVTGEPKLAPLRKQVGHDITDAERDAAWAVVNSEA